MRISTNVDPQPAIKKRNLLPRGNKWIYAECDMLSLLFPMLEFGHSCDPGFSLDHPPFVQAKRRMIQQSQINFPSPSSLFLLSCGIYLGIS